MNKLPRKSASQPQHLTKTSIINSAEHEATFLSTPERNGMPKNGLRSCVQNRRPNNAIWGTADAIKELEWVVRFFPEADPKTYLSPALANQAAGKHDAGVSALEKGRRLIPANALLQKLTSTKN
jgi:hypothetical protein